MKLYVVNYFKITLLLSHWYSNKMRKGKCFQENPLNKDKQIFIREIDLHLRDRPYDCPKRKIKISWNMFFDWEFGG